MQLAAISRRVCSTRWFLPAFTLVLGFGLGGAQWKGGDRQTGLTSMAFFVLIAAALALGGRSETIRMIRGDGRTSVGAHRSGGYGARGPRRDQLDYHRLRWEWAHGRDGTPFVQLGAIAGVACIAALAVLLRRS